MFFYNADSGAAASGMLNAEGDYSHLKDLGPFGKWTNIVPLDGARLFFYNSTLRTAAMGVRLRRSMTRW
jgi:hypothetical protein